MNLKEDPYIPNRHPIDFGPIVSILYGQVPYGILTVSTITVPINIIVMFISLIFCCATSMIMNEPLFFLVKAGDQLIQLTSHTHI